jgi:hypothetical protein
MKTYSVLYAEEVPHYGVAEIEAKDDAAALDVAKAHDFSDVALDAEREYSGCRRIVHIEDPDGNILHEDVPLDDWSVRYGDEKERRLWDAAPRLLKALQNCEQAIEEATDIMHYEDGLPVTALDSWEIDRAYMALCSVMVEVHQAIIAARGDQP